MIHNSDQKAFFALEEKLLKRYYAESGVAARPATLDEYLNKVVRATIERHKQGGAVAEKFEMAYLRPLDIGNPTKAEAEAAWTGRRVYKALQDYIFRFIAAECGRLGMAVHFHSDAGAGSYFNVAGGNPMLLEPLLDDPVAAPDQLRFPARRLALRAAVHGAVDQAQRLRRFLVAELVPLSGASWQRPFAHGWSTFPKRFCSPPTPIRIRPKLVGKRPATSPPRRSRRSVGDRAHRHAPRWRDHPRPRLGVGAHGDSRQRPGLVQIEVRRRAELRRLLIRPGAIGDVILSLPALEAARADYTEVWAPRPVLPLIRFADRTRAIADTGLDLVGVVEGARAPGARNLRLDLLLVRREPARVPRGGRAICRSRSFPRCRLRPKAFRALPMPRRPVQKISS